METELCSLAPSDWQLLSIEDVCARVTSGGTPSRQEPSYYVEGKWPWVKTQELQDKWIEDTEEHISQRAVDDSSAKVLPENTVLVAMYGATVGQLGILRRPMTCNQASCALIADQNKADYRYLFFLLLHARSQLKRLATGAAQQNLSGVLSKSLRFPFPPLPKQRAIASILGTLDDKIELNRRMNETLEAMAWALFKSWFVDFDPIRAKAKGSDPQALAPDAGALFPDAFDQDQMPLGWRLAQLSDVASVVMGASPPGETYNEQGVGVPLVNGPVEYGDFFLERKKWTTQPTRLSRKGDLILCVRGSTTGRHAFADDEYCLGRGVCAIRAIGSAQALVNRLVLDGLPKLLSKTTGSVFPNLSSEDIKSFAVVIPPLPIVELYCELVAPLDQRIWNNVSESRTLSLLRDSLLPRLISGQLRVEHAQQSANEVLGQAEDE
jgi:type I restriction enzyme, S subunit